VFKHCNWGKRVSGLFAFKIVVVYCICTVSVHLVWWGAAQGVEDHPVGFKIGLECVLIVNLIDIMEILARFCKGLDVALVV